MTTSPPTTVTFALQPDIRRLVVLGDPHGDVAGLTAIVERERGPTTQLLCVGDAVGYGDGPSSSQVCATLQHLGVPTVEGNHEAWADPYGFLAIVADPERPRYLTEEALAWINGLPHRIEVTRHDGAPVATLIHSIREPCWDWIGPENAPQVAADLHHPRLILSGHSHRPKLLHVAPGRWLAEHAPFDFLHEDALRRPLPTEGTLIVDAGSIGRPDPTELNLGPDYRGRRWGDWFGTYAVVELERGVVTLRRWVKRAWPGLQGS